MFEMRMAHLAPYVPVLMLLHAIERTLLGEKITKDALASPAVTLKRGDIFVQGLGCYLDYLQTTEQSGYLEKHFPHLRTLLLDECVASYKTFLQTPSWSSMYMPAQRTLLLSFVQNLYPDVEIVRNPIRKNIQLNPSLLIQKCGG